MPSKLSLNFPNGKSIHDSDADIWFQASQYAVDYGNMNVAEILYLEGQSIIELFKDVEKSVMEDKRKNYCVICGHHKNSHYETGEMIENDSESDPDILRSEYNCDGETDYDHSGSCDCNDLVLDVPPENV